MSVESRLLRASRDCADTVLLVGGTPAIHGERLVKRAGIDKHISPYSLRHSVVTADLDARVPLRDVQSATSHAEPRTTLSRKRRCDTTVPAGVSIGTPPTSWPVRLAPAVAEIRRGRSFGRRAPPTRSGSRGRRRFLVAGTCPRHRGPARDGNSRCRTRSSAAWSDRR